MISLEGKSALKEFFLSVEYVEKASVGRYGGRWEEPIAKQLLREDLERRNEEGTWLG